MILNWCHELFISILRLPLLWRSTDNLGDLLVTINCWIAPPETALWTGLLRHLHYLSWDLSVYFGIHWLVLLPFAPIAVPSVWLMSGPILRGSLGSATLQSFRILGLVFHQGLAWSVLLDSVDVWGNLAWLLLQVWRVVVSYSVDFQAISYRILILLVDTHTVQASHVWLLEEAWWVLKDALEQGVACGKVVLIWHQQ